MAPGGATMLLAAPDRLAVLDLERHEILGSAAFEGLGRLTRWDAEGSVLAWSFDRVGGAEGQVIPRGLGLVRAVARQVSNLEVRNGKLALRK